MENTANTELYNILVTHDFDPEILDSAGKSVEDPADAEMYSFDYIGPSGKNYGAVVILLDNENILTVFSGDNIGKTMDAEDKTAWYGTDKKNPGFLGQMKSFAVRNNLGGFNVENLNRLKYNMKTMAAIKEGLFEGYYGKKNISYSDQPMEARLMIKHSRDIAEGEARFRSIESLFVETADGSRYKLPHRNLMCGKVMARHCSEGGNPYDVFGQYINGMVTEMNTLGRFIRAARHKNLNDDAHGMLESAVRHYTDLKAKAKQMISRRGYLEARDAFDPAEINDKDRTVESIRDLFIETMLDQRIEEALPLLARLKETDMKEADEFESWSNQVMEGTWATPDTPEEQETLRTLLSQPLIVGPNAIDATTQLYDIVGDDKLFDLLTNLANNNASANAWDDPAVMARLEELIPGVTDVQPDTEPTTEALQGAPFGGAEPYPLSEDTEEFELIDVDGTPEEGDIHQVDNLNTDLLPGFDSGSADDDYSDSFYYQDPKTQGVFVVYTHGGLPRIRGTDNMSEDRVAEIAQSLSLQAQTEDLDTDGVMMTQPSNMSSESRESKNVLNRLLELARV